MMNAERLYYETQNQDLGSKEKHIIDASICLGMKGFLLKIVVNEYMLVILV